MARWRSMMQAPCHRCDKAILIPVGHGRTLCKRCNRLAGENEMWNGVPYERRTLWMNRYTERDIDVQRHDRRPLE